MKLVHEENDGLKNEINEVLPSFVEKIKGEQNAKN